MPDILTVATYNANSIRVRLEQVLDWLRRVAPDVLCVQETRCADKDMPVGPIHDAGYHVAFRGRGGRAGVAIISREPPDDIAYGMDDGDDLDDHRLIRARVRGIPIISAYAPQGRTADDPEFAYKLRWFARLRQYLERHYTPAQPLLLAGDLNVAPEPIDVYAPAQLAQYTDFHPEARRALAEAMAWGLHDVYRRLHPDEPHQYTFWDYRIRGAVEHRLGWRIDHILATAPLASAAVEAWIDVQERLAARPSDHTFVVARFDLSTLCRP